MNPKIGERWYYKVGLDQKQLCTGFITEITDKVVIFGGMPKDAKFQWSAMWSPQFIFKRNDVEFIERDERL